MDENTEFKHIPWICLGHRTIDWWVAPAGALILVTFPLSLWLRDRVQGLELAELPWGQRLALSLSWAHLLSEYEFQCLAEKKKWCFSGLLWRLQMRHHKYSGRRLTYSQKLNNWGSNNMVPLHILSPLEKLDYYSSYMNIVFHMQQLSTFIHLILQLIGFTTTVLFLFYIWES